MNFWKNLTVICCLALLTMQACNDPSTIGADLLGQDQINVTFTDTTALIAYTVRGDSAITYDPDDPIETYLLGQYKDPFFGLASSVISTQFRIASTEPNFENAILDSIVLILPYAATNSYGDLFADDFGLEVLELDEDMERDNIYSNKAFSTKGSSILEMGTQFVSAMPFDSTVIQVYGSDSQELDTLIPQIRLRLSNSFGEQIINQPTSTFESDTAFLDAFRGLQIRSTNETAGLLALDLISTGQAGVRLYFRRDTNFVQYIFPISSSGVKAATFTHDYSSVDLNDFLDNPVNGDSLLFVQGMSGVNAVFEFPNVDQYQDFLVNRAELELTIVNLNEDESLYPPISQIIISEIREDGGLAVIDDVIFGLQRNDLDDIFGGVPTEDDPSKYRLNISAHFRDMRDGIASNRLQITALCRSQSASRVIIYGPGHSEFPAKLNLNFTPF